MASYLQEIMNSLHPTLKRTQHVVEIHCPEGMELDTYPGALYQIVVNLVLNSLLHAFPGRNDGHITIGARLAGPHVFVTYRDDGIGMSDEVRRKIFEPFFTTRRGEGGSGLGLHIAYNLATQVLRGTITVESAPGQGVRFTVRFPVETRAVA
jgi:signal transduction histidine kinase